MASASYWDPNYAANRRALLESIAQMNTPGRPGASLPANNSASFLASVTGGSLRSPSAPTFADQQSAIDRMFQLKQQEALSAVAKRADQLSAARGMHIDGGQSIQMEQELSNEALGQLNQQQLGANADLMAQQRNYALQQQEMAMQQQRMAEQRRQFDAQMRAEQQARDWEQQQKERLYQEMRRAGTGAGGQQGGSNPFNTTMSLFQDGKSGTGSITGGPATGSGWDTRTGSERGLWAAPKAPSYSANNYETKEQAAERQASNPRSAGFDYSGSKNTGGHQVPGVPTSGPLTTAFSNAANWGTKR